MKSQQPPSSENPIFRERLTPSWPLFLAALIALPSFYLVFLPINESVGLVSGSLVTFSIWAAMFLGSPVIEVSEGQLMVAKAHIPLSLLGEAKSIEPNLAFEERGPRLDSRAYVRFQVGVRSLVRVQISDANDPTPYWLISTRRPVELIEAIKQAAS
ncbi:MAG: hypothetical protein RL196_1015 [Actinomycetota bacterium]|jgi:hypothetical protein